MANCAVSQFSMPMVCNSAMLAGVGPQLAFCRKRTASEYAIFTDAAGNCTGTATGVDVRLPGLGLVTLTPAMPPKGMATVPAAVSLVSDTQGVVSAPPAK